MTRNLTIVLLTVIVTIGAFAFYSQLSPVEAQLSFQQWEYALVIWDSSEREYSVTFSDVYELGEVGLPLEQSVVQELWEVVAGLPDPRIMDYLAVLGITGYELVSTETLPGALVFYYFKRPIN